MHAPRIYEQELQAAQRQSIGLAMQNLRYGAREGRRGRTKRRIEEPRLADIVAKAVDSREVDHDNEERINLPVRKEYDNVLARDVAKSRPALFALQIL